MRYSVIITVFFLVLPPGWIIGQTDPKEAELAATVTKFGQADVEIAYPGFASMTAIASRFSVSSCDGRKAVLTLAPRDIGDFLRTGMAFTITGKEKAKSVYTAATADEAMQWKSYPTWRQYDTIMNRIAETWPASCVLDTIGFSIMGRAILALKITDNPQAEENEPRVMLSASMHGDELAGFVLMMRLAEYLASHSNDGSLAQKLVSGLEIWINPLSNPDGMYRTHDSILYPVRANSNGYDLNRNYPDPEVTYPDPLQKENVEMISFLRKKHFVLSVNFHGGAEVVNYPWDKWTRLHADDQWFENICRRYADTVHLHSEAGYMSFMDNGITRGSEWYSIRGGRQDYVTWELRGREVTIEIDDEKQTPATRLDALWNYNYRSFLRYLEEALYGISGVVTSEKSGLPAGAKVFITGYDTDSSHVYTDTVTGLFNRYLAPGVWTLTITCDGFEPYIARDVVVEWNELTTLDIKLQDPAPYPDPPASGLLIYPAPYDGTEKVKILPPARLSGNVIMTVATISGSVVYSSEETYVEGVPFEVDLSHLPSGVYVITAGKTPGGPVSKGKILVVSCVQR